MEVMTRLFLLLCALVITQSGCSMLVMRSGMKVGELKNRDDVHKKLGEPVDRSLPEEKTRFEEYITRRKVAEPVDGSMVMGYMATLGLCEFLYFPYSMYHAVSRSILGQRLRFLYDPDGGLMLVELDGRKIWSFLEP